MDKVVIPPLTPDRVREIQKSLDALHKAQVKLEMERSFVLKEWMVNG